MNHSDGFRIRRSTPADLALVLKHRTSMFRDMGFADGPSFRLAETRSLERFAQGLADGTYQGWFIEDSSGAVVAGGGVSLVPFHPSPRDPQPHRPWIVNVYTEPPYRRRGFARMLLDAMVGWCREQGYQSVYLHASKDGQPLYASRGFHSTNEMRLDLER